MILWLDLCYCFLFSIYNLGFGTLLLKSRLLHFLQELYFVDFPNVKNNCLRFEVSPSVEESAGLTDADWAKLGNDFMQRMGLMNHQYIIVKHSGTEKNSRQAHLHILANRVSLWGNSTKTTG